MFGLLTLLALIGCFCLLAYIHCFSENEISVCVSSLIIVFAYQVCGTWSPYPYYPKTPNTCSPILVSVDRSSAQEKGYKFVHGIYIRVMLLAEMCTPHSGRFCFPDILCRLVYACSCLDMGNVIH